MLTDLEKTLADSRTKLEDELKAADGLLAKQNEGELNEDEFKKLEGHLATAETLKGQIEKAAPLATFTLEQGKLDTTKEYEHPTGESVEVKDIKSLVIETPYSKKLRVLDSPEYKEVFWANMRGMLLGKQMLTPDGMKTLNEGTGTAGGFIVPSDFFGGIVKNPPVDLVMFPRARRFNCSGDSLKIPVLNQGTNWQGGITINWTPEGEEKTETAPAFSQITIEIFNAAGWLALTKQLIQDAAFDIQAFVNELLREGIAAEVESTFFTGTGIGQPLGFLTVPGTTCTVFTPRAGALAISWADIVDMVATLPRQDWAGAIWIVSPTAWAHIMGWTDTANRPIMTPDPQGGFAETLRGKPIFVSDNCSTLGTVGDICLVNPKFYGYAIREDVEIISSNVAYDALFKNLTYVRAEMRIGAKPLKPMAFVVLDTKLT